MTALKTLLFSIVVPGTVAGFIPYSIISRQPESISPHPGLFRFLGLLPIAAGALLYCWCAWDFTFAGEGTPAPFDPPKKLVARGPYRYLRNPMYLAVCLVVTGEALLFQSTRLLNYLVFIFLGFNVLVIFYEEPTLRRKFGESYERYCKSVARWLPGMPYKKHAN